MNRTWIKVSVRYGAVAGVLAVVLLAGTFYMGRHPLLVSPFLDFRLLLYATFIFFALKEVRDYHQGGALYFWQGIIGSLMLVLTATLVGSLGLWIFGALETDFIPSYIAQMTTYLKSFPAADIERIGKDIYERNLSALPSTNIADMVETYFAQGLAIGFFVSIILSVILRKQPQNN